jgi:predicted dehydrogenase
LKKVLVIGCGNIAGGFDESRPSSAPPLTHAGAYRGHGAFLLSACVETYAPRRTAFMQHWGIPRGFATIEEAFNSGEHYDVVSICSPTKEHYRHLLACADSSASLVFCEKPICSTAAEAEYALDLLRQRGISVAVNHNRRWDPSVVSVQDEIDRGKWGKLRGMTGHYNKGVLNNGSHMLDLLAYLGGPLELLQAGPSQYDFWDSDPSIPAILLASGNVPVALNCGHAADYSLFEVQLVLEKAVVTMEDGGLRWRIRPCGPSTEFTGYTALTEGYVSPGRYMESMMRAVRNIHDTLMAGAALASTGETALAAQRLCAQIKALS